MNERTNEPTILLPYYFLGVKKNEKPTTNNSTAIQVASPTKTEKTHPTN